MRLILCDIDGTLRKTKSGKPFINEPDDQEKTPYGDKIINSFIDCLFVGITNQLGVAAGHKSLGSCIQEQMITLNLYPELEFILFCPDNGETLIKVFRDFDYIKKYYADKSEIRFVSDNAINDSGRFPDLIGTFRKPKSGMILAAILESGVSPYNCLMIGDRPEDQEAANNASVEFLSVLDF